VAQTKLAEATPGGLGSTYHHDPDMLRTVHDLIGEHPTRFGHLRGYTLAALRRDSKRTDDAFAVDKAGGSFVRNDRERGISAEHDAGVWFRGKWWDQMTEEQRRAWTFHQLLHLQTGAKGDGLRRVGHDVEAFAEEGLVFGAWDASLTLWQSNLDRHDSSSSDEDEKVAERIVKATTPKGSGASASPPPH
jgi:hypothetical protein